MATRRAEIVISMGAAGVLGATWLAVPLPAVAPVLSLLPIAVTLAFRSTALLCVLFVVFSFFRIHEVFPFLAPAKIPLLLAVSTLSVLAYDIGVEKKVAPYWSRELSYFLAFFLWATLGAIFAINKPIAIAYWTATYWKIGVMTLALAWLLRDARYFSIFSRGIVLAGSLVAMVAISNKLNGIGLVEGTRVTIGRDIGSVLGDPNDLALVLLFPLASAVSFVTYRNGFLQSLIGLASTILIVWAIICTQSRGGLLGMIAVFGIFGLQLIRSKLVLIGVALAGALLLFAVAGISGRQSGGAAEEGIDESAMGRIYAWQAAWNMAAARPLTGVGLDNFVPNYYAYSPHWDGHNHAVHSTWFNILAETGFPGLALFIAMAVRALISAYGSMKYFLKWRPGEKVMCGTSVATCAGLVSFFIAGTFLTQGFTWPVYILLAVTAALRRNRAAKITDQV